MSSGVRGIEATYLYEHWGYLGVIAAGIVVLLLTLLISQVIVRLMYKMLRKTTGGEVGGSIIANIVRVGVWVVGIGIILKLCFDFDAGVLWGTLGIGGIALSLGLQNTLSNLIGGLQASLSRDLALGDWITIGNVTGQVKDITWRVMKVQDSDGNTYIVPNSVLNTTALSVLPAYQTTTLPLVFSNMANLKEVHEKVPQIAYDALKKKDYLYEDMKPLLSIDGTAINSVNATLAVFTSYDVESIYIRECVIPPIVEYLRSADAFAAYTG